MVFNVLIAVSTHALRLFCHLPHHIFPKLLVVEETMRQSGPVGITHCACVKKMMASFSLTISNVHLVLCVATSRRVRQQTLRMQPLFYCEKIVTWTGFVKSKEKSWLLKFWVPMTMTGVWMCVVFSHKKRESAKTEFAMNPNPAALKIRSNKIKSLHAWLRIFRIVLNMLTMNDVNTKQNRNPHNRNIKTLCGQANHCWSSFSTPRTRCRYIVGFRNEQSRAGFTVNKKKRWIQSWNQIPLGTHFHFANLVTVKHNIWGEEFTSPPLRF